jgi:hypothetical protein
MYLIRIVCSISDIAEVQADLMTKRAGRKSPVAASDHYFNPLFKDMQPTQLPWVGADASRAIQPLEGMGHCVPSRFFYKKVINACFLPYIAIEPFSDTNLSPFTFSCLYLLTFYRCFQAQILPVLCH